ncbi:MAG: type II secretion system F family protein [Gemmataceae bacterium]
MHWLYFLTISAAVAVAVVAGYLAFVELKPRDEQRAAFRAVALRGAAPAAVAADAPLFRPVRDPAPSGPAVPFWRRDWGGPLRRSLERSGLGWRADAVVAASAACGLAAGAAGWALQGLLLGVPALLAGLAGPAAYVEMTGRARAEKFLSQLPGAFELMARVIRSGQSVPQAFHAVSDSFEDPIATAFARCREQQNLGLPPEAAFQELAEQSGVLDMRIFVMAMLIQRNAGGNLSEVLERLSSLIRERRRVRQQVQTLTAEGRLQATILLALPFFMLVAMRFVNQAYSDELFEHTSLLVATGVSMGLGALWIRKIINIDV